MLNAKPDKSYNVLCHYYINHIYKKIKDCCLEKGNKNIITETNGEILVPSVDKLLSSVSVSDDDIFIDLGSGSGKVVLQVFLQARVKKAIGIEIQPHLHQIALTLSKQIQSDLPNFFLKGRELTFLYGDFLKLPIMGATIVFMNSICFDQTILSLLGEVMDNTSSVHTLLSLRPIGVLQRLRFKKTIKIECSWDSALCYVYGE